MTTKKMRFSIEIPKSDLEASKDFTARANKLLNKCVSKVSKIVGGNGTVTITSDRKKKNSE